MATLHLKLLGGFEARIDDGPALLGSARKAQALLAYLAMSRGQPRTREHLADLLWGLCGEEQARNSLRQTLFVLRRGLGGFSGLVACGDQVSLNGDAYRVDVHDLEDLANQRSAPAPDVTRRSFNGDFMEGFSLREPAFQEWLEEERRHCQGLTQAVLRRRLVQLERGGSWARAIDVARLLLALDPLQEDVHRTLMRLFIAVGRRGNAVRQYEECRDVLRRELALSPDRKTEALAAAVRADRVPVQQPDQPPGPTPYIRPHLATVAVLPFTGSPAERTRGMTAEVIHTLSAWRHLAVIDKSTMLTYAAGRTSARQLGHELGAAYVIEGDIRVQNHRVRARIDLVDAQTSRILWTETFAERASYGEDTELTKWIAGRTTHEIDRAEGRRASLEMSGRLEPWQLFQRGYALFVEAGWEPARQAQEMFKRVLDLDPAFAPAMAALARSYHNDWAVYHLGEDSISRSVQTARRAIELDNLDSMAHVALSMGACKSHDHHLAVEEGHKAIRLNPSNTRAHVFLGNALAFAGKPLLGVARIKKGIRLTSPYDPPMSFFTQMAARSYLDARDYSAAVKWAEQSIRLRSNWAYTHFVHASALAQLRRWPEAEAAIERGLAIDPGCVDWEFSQSATKYANPADHDHVLDGVRQLGFG